MQHASFQTFISSLKNSFTFLFFLAWILGLLCGVGFFFAWEDSFFSLMYLLSSLQVSIVGLMNMLVLPYLLMNLLIHFQYYRLILVVTFLYASFYACTSVFIFSMYRSAGWLIHFFVLFSFHVSCCLFLWYGRLLAAGTDRPILQRKWLLCIACTGIMDYCFISPFLSSLLNFE